MLSTLCWIFCFEVPAITKTPVHAHPTPVSADWTPSFLPVSFDLSRRHQAPAIFSGIYPSRSSRFLHDLGVRCVFRSTVATYPGWNRPFDSPMIGTIPRLRPRDVDVRTLLRFLTICRVRPGAWWKLYLAFVQVLLYMADRRAWWLLKFHRHFLYDSLVSKVNAPCSVNSKKRRWELRTPMQYFYRSS